MSTRENRQHLIDSKIEPTFGKVPLSKVRRSDVQSWVGRLSAAGAAASSVEAYYRVLAAIMKSAVHDRIIGESPCTGIRLPRSDRAVSSLVPLTVAQVRSLAGDVPDRYRALVVVSAALGLRQGEACALTIDRIDFLRRKVTIDRQVVTTAAEDPCFGPVKTPASNRVIPLPAIVAEELAADLQRFGEGPDRLVFTTSAGTMISRQSWHKVFKAAADRLDIDASTHDLRHHAASLLISSGCSPRAVASFLGHRNAAETLNTYAHLWPTDEDRITAAIHAALTADDPADPAQDVQ